MRQYFCSHWQEHRLLFTTFPGSQAQVSAELGGRSPELGQQHDSPEKKSRVAANSDFLKKSESLQGADFKKMIEETMRADVQDISEKGAKAEKNLNETKAHVENLRIESKKENKKDSMHTSGYEHQEATKETDILTAVDDIMIPGGILLPTQSTSVPAGNVQEKPQIAQKKMNNTDVGPTSIGADALAQNSEKQNKEIQKQEAGRTQLATNNSSAQNSTTEVVSKTTQPTVADSMKNQKALAKADAQWNADRQGLAFQPEDPNQLDAKKNQPTI